MKKLVYLFLMLALLFFAYLITPNRYIPDNLTISWIKSFGPPSYSPPPVSEAAVLGEVEDPCPEDVLGWRRKQQIEGVWVRASKVCKPDNPYEVASFVKGTNRVSHGTLMQSGLAPDAVEKGRDLDGDGDPDEIHIRLEVMELNGRSPDDFDPITTFDIAPGIRPGFWVFAPKTFGMSTENFETMEAKTVLRVPSPVIRVEQGDTVKITLENTHYLPHTIHLHGVDHPFVDANGEGNDGVPQTAEKPIMPGESRTYDMTPRSTGTMMYHCHVQPHTHVTMGLLGMFVIEENRPNNWVQSMNVGAGHVRYPSAAIRESYDREYDLHYQSIDKELHSIVQNSNDPRVIAKEMNRGYDLTDADSDYFLLNGKTFPYTIQESLVITKPDEKVKLRVANAGEDDISLHPHGHKMRITHYDGNEHAREAQITKDVFHMGSAERIDLEMTTVNDGFNSYGEGIWVMHDHNERGITNNGMHPGGGITAITYESYLNENGLPKLQGVDPAKFFTEEFHRRETPVWMDFDVRGFYSDIAPRPGTLWRFLVIGLLIGAAVALFSLILISKKPK